MYTKEEYGFSFSPPKMAISPISKKVPLESMHPCKNAPSRKIFCRAASSILLLFARISGDAAQS